MAAVALMATGTALVILGASFLNPFAGIIVAGIALVLLGIDLARPGSEA